MIKIIVYGFNNYAKNLISKLNNSLFEVISIIDKRYQEIITYNNIPIICEDDAYSIEHDVMIIALQNAMLHDDIARRFNSISADSVIFVPMKYVAFNVEEDNKMREIYNYIMFEWDGTIEYEQGSFVKSITQDMVLKSECITKMIDNRFIYTVAKDNKDNELFHKYADVHISVFRPYNALMYYLMEDKQSDINEYLQDYGVNSCKYTNSFDNHDIIEQRRALFEIWEKHFEVKDGFFVTSAPLAEWNSNGYFNLLEGQHRCIYLYNKLMKKIPLRITKDDYNKYLVKCKHE